MEGFQKLKVQIRWIVRRDMPEILAIEADSFEFPWLEEDFLRCLRHRNAIGMLSQANGQVVGFMIYELLKTRLRILNFAVHPDFRRRGVGRVMAEKLAGKLSTRQRPTMVCEIRESNILAQKFFRAMGFKATKVLRDFYEDTEEDAYFFLFRHAPADSEFQPAGKEA